MYDEVVPLLDSSAAADKPSSAGKIKGAQVLDIITGIFSAILPALVAGGMLKGLLALAEIFGVNTGVGTCQILSMISDVPFYFLPFLLAISAARKFKVNEYLGVCMAGALMYPAFVEAVGADPSPFTFLGIAVPVFSYADSVCHNMAESGAAFGAALRMKDKELRSAALTTSFSAFLGISEPALFTVQVPNKTPLIAAMIANGIGGALTVAFGRQVLCLCHAGHYLTAYLRKRRCFQSADDGRLHCFHLRDCSNPLLHSRRQAGQ